MTSKTPTQAETGEAALRELLDTLPVAVYKTDAFGKITYFNQTAAALWGKQPDVQSFHWCAAARLFRPNGASLKPSDFPMAVAAREQREISNVEVVVERSDGARVPMLSYSVPLAAADGLPMGVLNMLLNADSVRRTDTFEQTLAAIVESTDDAVIGKDLSGTITIWNSGAERLFGYRADEVVGKPGAILMPPDRVSEESEILDRIRQGQRVEHYETVRRRKDGSLVDISLTMSPIRASNGEIIGASKIARDITDRKKLEEFQRLLMREMSHRVKNVLSVASGLVAMSARTAKTPQEMAKSVQARLNAFGHAHDLAWPDNDMADDAVSGAKTDFHAVLRRILSPYVDTVWNAPGGQIAVTGQNFALGGDAVMNLALVLHELTTNAIKYGALSNADGRIAIASAVDGDQMEITWKEQGGPPVVPPKDEHGFGTILARRAIVGHFGGSVSYDWRPEGVAIAIRIPRARLS